MNFVKLERMSIPTVEEYIIVNMDKVLTIETWDGCFRICFENEQADVLVEDCEENGAILEREIGFNPFKDVLCKQRN